MYLYFTDDLGMNPRKMAEYAQDGGYHSEEGTSWSFWTEGANGLGLTGEQIPLSEDRMKAVLDQGGLVVCSMAPGDFTTTGHFILLRGYDVNGFLVNDPNQRVNLFFIGVYYFMGFLFIFQIGSTICKLIWFL